MSETIRALEDAQDDSILPGNAEAEQAQRAITDCDRKLAQHRAALEAGADPALVTAWMKETQTQRDAAEARLGASTSQRPARMSEEQITALVEALGNILDVLRDADPGNKARIYSQLGLTLTYHPSDHVVQAEANLESERIWETESVRGGT